MQPEIQKLSVRSCRFVSQLVPNQTGHHQKKTFQNSKNQFQVKMYHQPHARHQNDNDASSIRAPSIVEMLGSRERGAEAYPSLLHAGASPAVVSGVGRIPNRSVQKCAFPNCSNQARMEGKCMRHFSSMSDEDAYASSPQQQSFYEPRVSVGRPQIPPISTFNRPSFGQSRNYNNCPPPVPQQQQQYPPASDVNSHRASPSYLRPPPHELSGYYQENEFRQEPNLPHAQPRSYPFSQQQPMAASVDSTQPRNQAVDPRINETSRPFSNVESEQSVPIDDNKSTGRVSKDVRSDEAIQRRERNRIAAQKSRQRKIDKIDTLSKEKSNLLLRNAELERETAELQMALENANVSGTQVISDEEYQILHDTRMKVICFYVEAYNSGNLDQLKSCFAENVVISGPQSSAQLAGRAGILKDYACTNYLYDEFTVDYRSIESDNIRSKYFQASWVFTGKIKNAGVSASKEFVDIVDSLKGSRVTIEGVTKFSFSGEKIIYIHRTAKQSQYLSALVGLRRCKK